MATLPSQDPERFSDVHVLRRKKRPPASSLARLEEQVARDAQHARRERPFPLMPPVSSLLWGGIAILGDGVALWGRVLLAVLSLLHWLLKRKAQWQYLYPEEIPDIESRSHFIVFLSGWLLSAWLLALRLDWL